MNQTLESFLNPVKNILVAAAAGLAISCGGNSGTDMQNQPKECTPAVAAPASPDWECSSRLEKEPDWRYSDYHFNRVESCFFDLAASIALTHSDSLIVNLRDSVISLDRNGTKRWQHGMPYYKDQENTISLGLVIGDDESVYASLGTLTEIINDGFRMIKLSRKGNLEGELLLAFPIGILDNDSLLVLKSDYDNYGQTPRSFLKLCSISTHNLATENWCYGGVDFNSTLTWKGNIYSIYRGGTDTNPDNYLIKLNPQGEEKEKIPLPKLNDFESELAREGDTSTIVAYTISHLIRGSDAFYSARTPFYNSSNPVSILLKFDNVGEFIWSFEAPSFQCQEPVIGKDNTIYWACGDLYALDQVDGSIKWIKKLFTSIGFTPTIGGSGIIYAARGTGLQAIDSSGSTLWTFSPHSEICSSPVIDAEGRMYNLTKLAEISALDIPEEQGLFPSPWPRVNADNQNSRRIP